MATTERSDAAYERWSHASQRFDYFMTGATGALCAYIVQSYVPEKLGISPGTLQLLALLTLIASAVVGFKRIESMVHGFALMHKRLHAQEARGSLVANLSSGPLLNHSTGEVYSPAEARHMAGLFSEQVTELDNTLDAVVAAATRHYSVRNVLLIAGVLLLLASKTWSAYV